jgi:hypothetical protein
MVTITIVPQAAGNGDLIVERRRFQGFPSWFTAVSEEIPVLVGDKSRVKKLKQHEKVGIHFFELCVLDENPWRHSSV